MAAVTGHLNFWNWTGDSILHQVWLSTGNSQTIPIIVAVSVIILSPIIVFGNLLVVFSIWKDPLKKLWSWPSNYIILSMAVADLMVGIVTCPLTAYWGWAVHQMKNPTFGPVTFSITFLNISVTHMLLLTIDRFFALVTPLQYRTKVTRKRVCIATVTCWVYFLLFGFAFSLSQDHFTILAAINNLQMFSFLICIFLTYFVMLYRFHKYSRSAIIHDSTANRHRRMFQAERNLSKAVATVICVFLICFIPWLIVQLLMFFCLQCNGNLSQLILAFGLTQGLVYGNSGVNPFLYAWRIPRYRATFKYFLNNRSRCCVRNEQPAENVVYDTRF